MSFYYLGFQRAPPSTVHEGEKISISPTILNDLRDEVYLPESDEEIHIQVAWIASHKGSWKVSSLAATIPWIGSQSSYKQCQITVPNFENAKMLGDVRLALWATSNDPSPASTSQMQYMINLSNSTLETSNKSFLPALSAPMQIYSSRDKKELLSKSYNIIRLFKLGQDKVVEIEEEAGYELDKHVWDASLLLTAFIEDKMKSADDSLFPPSLGKDSKELRVVELGAGTGLVSISLACVIATLISKEQDNEKSVHLTATDLESALPLLKRNIDRNRAIWEGLNVTIECKDLDWCQKSSITDSDLVLVSDCTYNTSYFQPLCETIETLLRQGKPNCYCLLAKKHRHIDEEALWSEMAKSNLEYTLLAGQQAVEGGNWGIWKVYL